VAAGKGRVRRWCMWHVRFGRQAGVHGSSLDVSDETAADIFCPAATGCGL